ncbi:alpha/beta fold hydrolase [Candidatus Frankia nodulisporulans]|uniref:alpha/beta fold hydrolase n=1 Tax=Candidatus Frankia nodulisporulans TaxID=2060052 RepID=UPI001CDD4EC1|nr:alpha/beta fold hydrolase [Candidatus Frankia nodulisporulans]
MVDARQWRVPVDGGLDLHVELLTPESLAVDGPAVAISPIAGTSGAAGGPMVLVHGIAGSAQDWAAVSGDLATRRHVAAYDHRGHGASGWATGGREQYTFDLLLADLVMVIDSLGPTPVNLLGHSMGGVIALRYALEHPRRVRSLILVDTAAEPAHVPGPLARRIVAPILDRMASAFAGHQHTEPDGPSEADDDITPDDLHAVDDLAAAQGAGATGGVGAAVDVGGGIEVTAGDIAENEITEKEVADHEVTEIEMTRSGPTPQQRAADGLGKVDPEALSAFGRELGTYPSLVPSLGEITVPTTVIVGEHDSSLRASARTMADAIPGARLSVIAGADHSPHASRPLAWLTAIDDHFARIADNPDPARPTAFARRH